GQAVISNGHWLAGRKTLLAAIAAGAMLFLLLGSDPRSDLVVHLAGFVTGTVLGMVSGRWMLKKAEDDWAQSVTGITAIGLLALAWFVAIFYRV
ncbi:MAG TPA: hypothetical protein VK968_08310, partial [Roseimicrobium sp.]|nr:hypothetical protein [Roseimicrobium sp.]